MHNGDCYSDGSYFWDSGITAAQSGEDSPTNSLKCVLAGSTESNVNGQWINAKNNDSVDCNSNNEDDPFRCFSDSSSDLNLNLYLPFWQGLSANEEGLYKCCLPNNCYMAGTKIIMANIFSKLDKFTDFILNNI